MAFVSHKTLLRDTQALLMLTVDTQRESLPHAPHPNIAAREGGVLRAGLDTGCWVCASSGPDIDILLGHGVTAAQRY
ncbi:hypothetical protein AA103196_3087 [Ameyamaea chiangmaiensis NBRC 103196]|nr:hypothetical protein AA103196_3087 [Ameyamaea chiangmaiensis NBRC 103196]